VALLPTLDHKSARRRVRSTGSVITQVVVPVTALIHGYGELALTALSGGAFFVSHEISPGKSMI
jgi:hypothetical protein